MNCYTFKSFLETHFYELPFIDFYFFNTTLQVFYLRISNSFFIVKHLVALFWKVLYWIGLDCDV